MIKKFASFFAVFGFVMVLSECYASNEMAQLPARLSIGSEEIVLNSTVGNPHSQIFIFMSFKEPDIAQEYGILSSPIKTFQKYTDFLVYVRTNAVCFRNEILAWPKEEQPSLYATAKLYVVVWVSQPIVGNYDWRSEKVTLEITKNLGNFWDFSTNSLVDLPPHNIRSVTWLTNVTKVILDVHTPSGVYQNQWSQEMGSWTNGYRFEEMYKNILFHDVLYSMGTNRTRITLTSTSQEASSKSYTQAGEAIQPPVMSIDNKNVGVHLSRGADTILQSSTNGGKDWLNETSCGWASKTNLLLFPVEIRSNTVLKIFRAKSY